MSIYFHAEDTNYKLKSKRLYKKWIADIVTEYGYSIGDFNFIFASNEYILEMNKKYLNHHYNTDVITFNYNNGVVLSGDIFISVDQVKINSKKLEVLFIEELNRVIIHGVLHLIGFDDQTEDEQQMMRKKENLALQKFALIRNENNI